MVEFLVFPRAVDDWVAIWIFLVGHFFTRIIGPMYSKKFLLPTLLLWQQQILPGCK